MTAAMPDRALHILTEAAALFAERGYERTSMRDLAERCGVSKALLYHHFADKEELYTRIALGFTAELYDHVVSRIPDAGSTSARVRAFMVASAEFFERHRHVWLASTDAFWSDPDLRRSEERLAWRRRYEGLLRQLLADGAESGELALVDVAMAGRLVLSALNWMPRWYRAGGTLDAVAIAGSYHDMIFGGLTPRTAFPAGRTPPAP